MLHDARSIANHFLDRGEAEDIDIDNLKLQKLVYIAHGWHLAITDGALFKDLVQAWPYGPVIPSVYHEFKWMGKKPINVRGFYYDPSSDGTRVFSLEDVSSPETPLKLTCEVLDGVWEKYKNESGVDLSARTHADGTPWAITVGSRPPKEIRDLEIPNDLIRKHYIELAMNQRNNAQHRSGAG
jgi:uncharacterized phage-associated protein